VFFGQADFDPAHIHIGNPDPLTSAANSGDIFVAKVDTNGNIVWAHRAGGGGFDIGTGITFDQTGRLFVIGLVTGTAHVGSLVINANKATNSSFVSEIDTVKGAVLATVASANQGLQGGDRAFANRRR